MAAEPEAKKGVSPTYLSAPSLCNGGREASSWAPSWGCRPGDDSQWTITTATPGPEGCGYFTASNPGQEKGGYRVRVPDGASRRCSGRHWSDSAVGRPTSSPEGRCFWGGRGGMLRATTLKRQRQDRMGLQRASSNLNNARGGPMSCPRALNLPQGRWHTAPSPSDPCSPRFSEAGLLCPRMQGIETPERPSKNTG